MRELTSDQLTAFAKRVLFDNNFAAEMPPEIVRAAQALEIKQENFSKIASVRDLRSLRWSSIDNKTSLDLDQVEYTEKLANGDIRVLVGIADVDEFVPQNSLIDRFAAKNTVSIYAGNRTFPMLPEELSTDLTSLLQDRDRYAVVTEMAVCEDGSVCSSDVYRAIVRNYAKLTYEEVGAWLDDNAAIPTEITELGGMEAQIRLQQEAAKRLYALRKKNGALEFETIESSPVIKNDKITDLETLRSNSAREIIENFMIAANVTMAEFLEKHNVVSLRRVVKTPARWNRIVEVAATFGEHLPETPDSKRLAEFLAKRKAADPIHYPDLSLAIVKLLGPGEYVVQSPEIEAEGHFGLAVQDYTHSTAPNRRYTDLIVQRLVKAVIERRPAPYTVEELEAIANHCNERGNAARKVEREMRKVIAASVMAPRIGEIFDAIVTGVTPKGIFARTLRPPVDGRIVKNEAGLQVGDKIRVRLIATEPERGFIDFEHVR